MARESKFYVVWKGRKPGIYTSWEQAEAQVKGFPGAQFKSYSSMEEAQEAFESGRSAHLEAEPPQPFTERTIAQKSRFYVVWKGRQPGIYTSWGQAEAQIRGFSGAEFKSFGSLAAAREALRGAHEESLKPWDRERSNQRPEYAILSVDSSYGGNPKQLRYRGILEIRINRSVHQVVVFEEGPFEDATNNVGEFLAVVRGLEWCQQNNLHLPIYSDSMVALSWVRQKRCKTAMERTERNQRLFELIEQAERWLAENEIMCSLEKWETRLWGEIPADYGRKKMARRGRRGRGAAPTSKRS